MNKLIKFSDIKGLILELRGQKVMLDRDLARLYQVSTRRLNEQVKRNIKRFPADFMFQLNDEEAEWLVSQNAIPHKKYLGGHYPYAFTRNGANMLCTVLRSPVAIQRSIQIMRAFSTLEEVVSKGKNAISESPKIIKQLSVYSKAIMHLFQKDRLKTKHILKLDDMQKEVIALLQQIVLDSLKRK